MIRTISQSQFFDIKGKFISEGSEKKCYLHRTDPSKCIKISNKNNCSQTIREIKYFKTQILMYPNFLWSLYCQQLHWIRARMLLVERAGGNL